MENHTTFPSLQQTPSFPYETENPKETKVSSLRHKNVDQVQKTESDHSF